MAIYNEILEGRFARGLQKLFAIKSGPPTRQLGAEIMPIHPLFSGKENAYLEGWNDFGFAVAVGAGGAGTFAASRLRNPAGSNIIALITRVYMFDVSNLITPQWTLGYGHSNPGTTGVLGDLSSINSPPFLAEDTRTGGVMSSVCIFSNGSPVGAATPGATAVWFGASGSASTAGTNPMLDALRPVDVDFLPLLPNDTLTVFTRIANVNANFGWMWRERTLTESERQ